MKPEEMRAMREELGLTQEQLADKLDVHRITVSRWENGTLDIEHRTRLAMEHLTRKRTHEGKLLGRHTDGLLPQAHSPDILITKRKPRKHSVVIGFRLDADVAMKLEEMARQRGIKASTAAGIIVGDYIERHKKSLQSQSGHQPQFEGGLDEMSNGPA
jgi:DNA-binding XRE family transcriptional regulator